MVKWNIRRGIKASQWGKAAEQQSLDRGRPGVEPTEGITERMSLSLSVQRDPFFSIEGRERK